MSRRERDLFGRGLIDLDCSWVVCAKGRGGIWQRW